MSPGNQAHRNYQLGQALVQKRMYNEAIAELQRAVALAGDNSTFASNLAFAYAVSGRKDEAVRILNGLKNRDQTFSNFSEISLIYAGLGEKDQAMIWLEKAYEERFNPSILKRPAFDLLRSHPGFQDLLRRIGLSNEL